MQANAEVLRFNLVEVNTVVIISNTKRHYVPGFSVQCFDVGAGDMANVIRCGNRGSEFRQQKAKVIAAASPVIGQGAQRDQFIQ